MVLIYLFFWNYFFPKVPWFPMSFNLRSQLPAFCVEHYQKGVSAMWMLRCANPRESHFKPVISSNLRRIIRLGETAPLIASQCKTFFAPTATTVVIVSSFVVVVVVSSASCDTNTKLNVSTSNISFLVYISMGVSHQKHFCLQFSVIVPSLKPLSLLIHNTPRIRTPPKKFDPMDDLDEYDSSSLITTSDKAPQNPESMEEFLKDLKKNYLTRKQSTWEEVKKNIDHNIYELFLAVSNSLSRPGKVGSENQTTTNLCAVYGVDVLILEDLSVVVIGVDAVPSFPNDQVAKEVLFVAYSDQEMPATLESRFTKVTCEE